MTEEDHILAETRSKARWGDPNLQSIARIYQRVEERHCEIVPAGQDQQHVL